jgi:HK97 family phage major capsid protein
MESEGKAEHEHVAAFVRYIDGDVENLSDEDRNRLIPTGKSHRDALSKTKSKNFGARLPRTFAKVMLSTDTTEYSTDSGTGVLRDDPLIAQLLQMPVAMPNLFQLCRKIVTTAGRATIPVLDQPNGGNFGGVAHTWKASEGLTKGETFPYFTDFNITTDELSSWTEMNLTAISRSVIDLTAEVVRLLRDAAHYEWSRVILNGSGTNQPTGIVDYSGINSVTRNAAGAVSWVDLVGLIYAVSQGNRQGSQFVLDDSVEQDLMGQEDADGKPLFTASVASTIVAKLAGRNYIAHEHTPALGTAGDIVFGNWNQYMFAIEEDITIARSDEAEFKKGNVVFRMISFVGGKPIQPTAFAQLTTV